MDIETSRFGKIVISEEKLFSFVMPIIGFDELSKFVLLEHNDGSMFKWLQSTENPLLAFPVVSCANLSMDYVIDLPDNAVDALQVEDVDDLLVLNIASIPSSDPSGATINLLAPLIFNIKNKLAGQIILSGSGYEVSCPIFDKGEAE